MIRSCLIDIIYGTYQPSRKTATILVNVDATATHRQSVLRAQLCRDIEWVQWASCPYCLSRLTRIRRSVAKWRNQIARSARGQRRSRAPAATYWCDDDVTTSSQRRLWLHRLRRSHRRRQNTSHAAVYAILATCSEVTPPRRGVDKKTVITQWEHFGLATFISHISFIKGICHIMRFFSGWLINGQYTYERRFTTP